MHHIQCTVNENKNVNIMFYFRQGLGTCVECKQPQLLLRLKVHYERCGQRGDFNTRGRSRPAIFGIRIYGESLTLLNLIGDIRHAH